MLAATDALVGIVVCIALSVPDLRRSRAPPGALQGIPGHYFLTSFNSAHLLLAFFCWLHCFLTVLAAVAGLFSTPFLSFSFPLDS